MDDNEKWPKLARLHSGNLQSSMMVWRQETKDPNMKHHGLTPASSESSFGCCCFVLQLLRKIKLSKCFGKQLNNSSKSICERLLFKSFQSNSLHRRNRISLTVSTRITCYKMIQYDAICMSTCLARPKFLKLNFQLWWSEPLIYPNPLLGVELCMLTISQALWCLPAQEKELQILDLA